MQTAQTNPITGNPYRHGYNPGTDSGAITLEWRGHILRATVRPFRDPSGERHTIEVNSRTGRMTCSCEAFRYARHTEYGQVICKHIQAWAPQLADELSDRLCTVPLRTPAVMPIGPAYRISEDPF